MEDRHHSWRFQRTLNVISHQAWLCMGDFNEPLLGTEHFSRRSRPEWQIRAFRGVIEECGFSGFGMVGCTVLLG